MGLTLQGLGYRLPGARCWFATRSDSHRRLIQGSESLHCSLVGSRVLSAYVCSGKIVWDGEHDDTFQVHKTAWCLWALSSFVCIKHSLSGNEQVDCFFFSPVVRVQTDPGSWMKVLLLSASIQSFPTMRQAFGKWQSISLPTIYKGVLLNREESLFNWSSWKSP